MLDEVNEDFLSFCSALDKEIFSESERCMSLAQRDRVKVKWMTDVSIQYFHSHLSVERSSVNTVPLSYSFQCALYRRRFSVGGGKKLWTTAMRKRLNTYASKKRAGMAEDAVPTTEDQVEEEEEEEEEAREEGMGEGERPREGQYEEDDTEGMDGSERMGGRMAAGSEISGVYDYLRDHNFDA